MKRLALLAVPGLLSSPSLAGTLVVPDDHATIQAAIGAAVAGDPILVRPGTYPESIDFSGKAITVRSESGPGAAIIDGGNPVDPNKGSCVHFETGGGPGSVLEGFTLRNGTGRKPSGSPGGYGGGIWCDGASPAIRGCAIEDNHPSYDGGGICCAGGGLIRLRVRNAGAEGTSSTTLSIAAKGSVSAGDTRSYQCWYRTTQAPPCGVGVNDFNLSNGYRITWLP